jgi:hypothetical protein
MNEAEKAEKLKEACLNLQIKAEFWSTSEKDR